MKTTEKRTIVFGSCIVTLIQLALVGWTFSDDGKGSSSLLEAIPIFLGEILYFGMMYLYFLPLAYFDQMLFGREPSRLVELLMLLPLMIIYSLAISFFVHLIMKVKSLIL